MRRDGARTGDGIWIAGSTGLAGAGLRFLLRAENFEAKTAAEQAAVRAWRRPRARIEEGLRVSRVATAAIDISDGLARDLGHLARASGVSVVIDTEPLASDELRAVAALLGVDPLELILHGGEDYALVVTAPKGSVLEGFVAIGECRPPGGPGSTVFVQTAGNIVAMDEQGYDHFDKELIAGTPGSGKPA
jgi:thiamine-monophosphate kinase